MNKPPVHLFLHIPKTAGTTIHRIAYRQYASKDCYIVGSRNQNEDDFKCLSPTQRSSYAYIGGHFSYGFHRRIDSPCLYFTMLRDPSDLAISLYHYVLRYEMHPLHEEMLSRKISFERWLGFYYQDNFLLRHLLGVETEDPLTIADLNHATALLVENFATFGLVSRFDESLLLIHDALGWQAPPFYVSKNVYHRSGDQTVLTDEANTLMQERHSLSFDLLTFANGLFDSRLLSEGQTFNQRLVDFRSQNRVWQDEVDGETA